MPTIKAEIKRLNRSLWEGCEKCKPMADPCHACGTPFSQICSWDCKSLEAYRKQEDNLSGNYCNNCGRPLTDEAWARLEERITGCNPSKEAQP